MAERTVRVSQWPMWALGLVVLMDEVDKNIVRGLIDPIKEAFGVGDFGIGLLLSAALLFNGLITVPAGYLADRWHRTRAIGWTIVGWSALTALGATAPTFAALVGFRAALGFGQAVSEPSSASLIGDYFPYDQRGKAFSIQMVALFAGTGIGVGLGGVLGTTVGWRPALVIVAIPGLIVAMIMLRLREPKRGAADRLSMKIVDELEYADPDEQVQLFDRGFRVFVRDLLAGLRADIKTILRIRTMRYALVGVAALLFTITAIAAWLPQFYIRHFDIAEGKGELWFTGMVILGGVPGVLLGGRAADRWAPRMQGGRLALPAIFLMVGNTFFGVSYVVRVFPIAYVLQIIALFIVSMAVPGLRAGLTDAIPHNLRGAGFGAFNVVAVVAGQAAAPSIIAGLSSIFDENLRVAFLIVTPITFVGAGILFHARKFLDDDMQAIAMAVVTAMQEEQQRQAELAAEREAEELEPPPT